MSSLGGVIYQGDIESVLELRERGLRAMAYDRTITPADREDFVEKMGMIVVSNARPSPAEASSSIRSRKPSGTWG